MALCEFNSLAHQNYISLGHQKETLSFIDDTLCVFSQYFHTTENAQLIISMSDTLKYNIKLINNQKHIILQAIDNQYKNDMAFQYNNAYKINNPDFVSVFTAENELNIKLSHSAFFLPSRGGDHCIVFAYPHKILRDTLYYANNNFILRYPIGKSTDSFGTWLVNEKFLHNHNRKVENDETSRTLNKYLTKYILTSLEYTEYKKNLNIPKHLKLKNLAGRRYRFNSFPKYEEFIFLTDTLGIYIQKWDKEIYNINADSIAQFFKYEVCANKVILYGFPLQNSNDLLPLEKHVEGLTQLKSKSLYKLSREEQLPIINKITIDTMALYDNLLLYTKIFKTYSVWNNNISYKQITKVFNYKDVKSTDILLKLFKRKKIFLIFNYYQEVNSY